MYYQASSINHSTSHIASWLGRKPRYAHPVGNNSLETTYILLELPSIQPSQGRKLAMKFQWFDYTLRKTTFLIIKKLST